MIHITQEYKIGDCLELLPEMEESSVDLIVTDPPYGYSFLGRDWDKAVPSVEIWQECLRVLKSGAFAFIMSAPRQDVLAHNLVNLSDAGFNTAFSSIYHCYGSGFPKASNISKLVDKRMGAEREVVGTKSGERYKYAFNHGFDSGNENSTFGAKNASALTIPATPEAKALDGSYAGAQFKPAVEVIMVVMKPLSEKTYVDQALANQKGITWMDDGRIPYEHDCRLERGGSYGGNRTGSNAESFYQTGNGEIDYSASLPQGRFPANLLVSDDALNDGKERNGGHFNSTIKMKGHTLYEGGFNDFEQTDKVIDDSGSFSRYFSLDAWWDERIKHLPKEAQKTFPFMIVPKASKSEKGADNKHPTVKPVKLFSWLMTIGSREGDLVVDPFLGSGTTLEAGRMTNRNVVGFEIGDEWEHLYPDRCMTHTPTLQSYFDGE